MMTSQLIFIGIGSLPVTTSLWSLNSPLCDLRFSQIRSINYDLFVVTVKMTFCEGKRVELCKVYVRLAPLSLPACVDFLILPSLYL